MKGEPNYHNQMFLSLLQFVRTMSNASKIQLTDAIKSANLYVADFSMTAAHRAKVKKLIPLMRAELKGFAKGRQINPRKKNPEIEIRELILFAENSPSLHNQYVSIMKNLSRKKKRGIYDPVLAAKLWKYWIDEGVKQYNLEVLGGGRSLVQSVFTMDDRKQAAIEMEDQEQEGVFSMEYLELKNPVGSVSSKRAPLKIYEIYTKHPTTGEGGWEIEWVRSTDKEIKSFPLFDEIITVNDFPMQGDSSIIIDWHLKGNPKKKRAKKKATRKKNPKSKTYFAFLCWQKGTAAQGQVTYAYITDTRKARVGITATKRDAAIFQTKTRAKAVAQLLAENWPGAQAGIAPSTATVAQIRASCKPGKV